MEKQSNVRVCLCLCVGWGLGVGGRGEQTDSAAAWPGLPPPYEFPVWWFAAISAHMFPMAIIEGIIRAETHQCSPRQPPGNCLV